MIKKPIAKFNNGNNVITLYDDGTQIVKGDMNFEYPLTIDCKISSLCTVECPYCYEGNNPNGKIADFNQEWINSLPPYTEIAVNLNDPIDNESLDVYNFLNKLKEKKIITNVTINFNTFKDFHYILEAWQKKGLIYGIGVSLTDKFFEDPEFYVEGRFKKFKNLVIHTIFGITSYKDYKTLSKYYPEAKILILGYKDKGRGINYHKENKAINFNQKQVLDNFEELYDMFDTIAFDCLAVKQLDIKNKVPKDVYELNYLGDDGTRSMYIDMVNKKFAKSSLSDKTYNITNNIKEMFNIVKSEKD